MPADLLRPTEPSPREPEHRSDAPPERLVVGLHDLGNLLHVTLASAEEGLEEGSTEPQFRRALERCRAATERAVELLRTLGPAAPGPDTAPSPPGTSADLDALAAEAVELLRGASPRGVRVRLADAERGGHTVAIDPGLLHRALLNLVRNACEAVGEAGDVVVRCARGEPGTCMVEVRDDGAGMDAETLARATEPGFSRRGVGRGLGLAFVEALARDAGGRLELESDARRGTVARLTLPSATA